MFLERLQASRLWELVLEQVRVNRSLQLEADERAARSGRLSSRMFLHGLERPLWARLALQAGLMPAGEQGAQAVAPQEHFEYQEPPWERRNDANVIKGTNLPFEADENMPYVVTM